MLSYFNEYLRIDLPFEAEKPILVGVSGGPDSICLLDFLKKNDFSVIAAHLDHSIRPDSDEDARKVMLFADAIRVPYVLEKRDVPALASEKGLSLEEAGRIARYGFLFEQAQKIGAQAVAVGHNADDQVETILMHFLMGAGVGGLKGMESFSLPNPWSQDIPLVRPLLSIWRKDIEDYCQERGIDPIIDSSNIDTTFFRNRLRNQLIPQLDEYVPGIRKRLWHLAEIVTAEDLVLEGTLKDAIQECLVAQGEGFASFDIQAFVLLPLAIQRRMIRWAVSNIRADVRELDFAAVKRGLALVHSESQPRAKGVDLSLGIRAFIEDNQFFIAGWEADLPSQHWPQIAVESESGVFRIPGEFKLSEGWFLRGEQVDDLEIARYLAQNNSDPFQAWIDLGEHEPALNIRSRDPGDRFNPLGMGGNSVKVSDFMINKKIPQRARDGWPLVYLGDQIVWVPGFRISHDHRLTRETRRAIHLTLAGNPIAGLLI
jgi:tRNA(Ile)-lysidine synthase